MYNYSGQCFLFREETHYLECNAFSPQMGRSNKYKYNFIFDLFLFQALVHVLQEPDTALTSLDLSDCKLKVIF